MSAINQALSSGYGIPQILNFLIQAYPQLRPKILQAKAAGYSIEKIIDFISQTAEGGKPDPNLSQSESHALRMEKQGETVKGFVKGAAALGATALGSYALSRALPAAVQAIAPGLAGGVQQAVAPQPQGPAPQGMADAIPTTGTLINSAPAAIEAPDPSKAALHANLLKQMRLDDKILAINSKNPADIAAALEGHFMTPSQKKWLATQTSEPMSKIVEDFLQTQPQQQAQPAQAEQPITPQTIAPAQSPAQLNAPNEQTPEPEAKKLVALPGGDLGEVESERNGIAKISVDGTTKHRKLDEVVESPLPQKDLAALYDDVIAGIEKQTGAEVSRNVYWAGYDPTANELIYIPHGGRAYIYDGISEEDKNNLTSVLSQRKSSGENYIGAWGQGTKSPIGAAMYQLIQKLQKERGGKGNEYKSRFETIYDALELAKTKAKEKHERTKIKKAQKSRAR